MATAADGVHLPRDGLTDGERGIQTVKELVPLEGHIQHARTAEDASVGPLPALAGEEGGTVEKHEEVIPLGAASTDRRLEDKKVLLIFVQFCCHIGFLL
jgi:hypothetical protein